MNKNQKPPAATPRPLTEVPAEDTTEDLGTPQVVPMVKPRGFPYEKQWLGSDKRSKRKGYPYIHIYTYIIIHIHN